MSNYLKRLVFDFVTNVIAPQFWIPGIMRKYIYRIVGLNINTTEIKRHCYFNSNKISVGEGSLVNSFSKLYSSYFEGGTITIGKKCYIGMNTLICTITHEVGSSDKRAGENKYMPIVLEDGCWIGANSTILPGVTVGKGCIVAAGAVVSKDCEANGVYAGVPAKKIKDLSE
ncbi:acyltransferase [Fictibacillus sp. UD]|uniref:acyltransferase n=1 Tax=Fictibacillus sp. UD TaxID=3038777 RepID=UPI0037457F82